jgi:hypothetical protein
MKIFTQDNGWAGCIVVTAKDENDARSKMECAQNYDRAQDVVEWDINSDFFFANYGDM